ncbi:MAG TPA: DUF2334 domain-containing protein, partial [bacterium]|nr:DUF2334 domain-containing protein [bacterium]
DFNARTPLAEARAFREWLKARELPVTFFVIPRQRGEAPLGEGDRLDLLRALAADGHEIAQHGYAHFCPRNREEGLQEGAEMALLGREEAEKRIAEGRRLLRGLGFDPIGHRSPCFSGTVETVAALADLGFLYGSDMNLPACTPRNIFWPDFPGRILYPWRLPGIDLLEITGQTDPTVHPAKARAVFDRIHARSGVAVFLTHLPQIGERENLDRLGEFVEYVRARPTWICRLDQLARWWTARERLEIETSFEDGMLKVTISNPSPYPLERCRLVFATPGPFLVETAGGVVLARGAGEEAIVDIPLQAVSAAEENCPGGICPVSARAGSR